MSRAEIEAVMKMKPSAYRSMLMGKLGLTKKSKKGRASLCRWGSQKKGEKWINLTALLTDKKVLPCGKKGERQKELGWPSVSMQKRPHWPANLPKRKSKRPSRSSKKAR